MPLFKNINGVQQEMTAEEEAAERTRWADNDAASVPTKAARIETFLDNDDLWRAFIRVAANRFGITVPQLIAAIKAQVQ